ncbi:hypothetical protein RHABOEDO_001168 [Candidatus Rhabdochlamydia oedothoracis]|uniref:Uncharacterized protein n=1 Tax=Candidatus Rhabdochlamydia oedothoracis TaxID=2720720 RepID=A0ABX8V5S4_9BACT|nr:MULTISPECIES: hypothetical protein [Rhabdochlamydia]KAG6558751.1 hypothetical protein RHOW815_001256 [Candidatus Rhabdochlamydia sp. W815]QYF48927.1 hypothetical protein RHABOEDO_001168 [Candidatus Rhabdochlamydia oedothoracis]
MGINSTSDYGASYIYYPFPSLPLGHAELEINGKSYTFTNITEIRDTIITEIRDTMCCSQIDVGETRKVKSLPRIKILSQMIERAKSRTRCGSSFFRFNISVTPNQLDELKKNAVRINSINCSVGVAKALKQFTDLKIPPLFVISPLALAFYLTMANKLGSQHVSQIEFHHNSSLKNLSKSILGGLVEAAGLFSLVFIITQSNLRDIYYFIFDSNSFDSNSSEIAKNSIGLLLLWSIILDGYYLRSCSNLLIKSAEISRQLLGYSLRFIGFGYTLGLIMWDDYPSSCFCGYACLKSI